MEIKDHQNPSQEPLINERGNSSLFQYVSCVFPKIKDTNIVAFSNDYLRA